MTERAYREMVARQVADAHGAWDKDDHAWVTFTGAYAVDDPDSQHESDTSRRGPQAEAENAEPSPEPLTDERLAQWRAAFEQLEHISERGSYANHAARAGWDALNEIARQRVELAAAQAREAAALAIVRAAAEADDDGYGECVVCGQQVKRQYYFPTRDTESHNPGCPAGQARALLATLPTARTPEGSERKEP